MNANSERALLQEVADRLDGIKGGAVSETIAMIRAMLAAPPAPAAQGWKPREPDRICFGENYFLWATVQRYGSSQYEIGYAHGIKFADENLTGKDIAPPAPAVEPTLPIEIYGKLYDVPIAVQVHIVALEERLETAAQSHALQSFPYTVDELQKAADAHSCGGRARVMLNSIAMWLKPVLAAAQEGVKP